MAPSFRMSWWMYFPHLACGALLLGRAVLAKDVVLVATLPVWAMAAETLLSTHSPQIKYLFGYWWPQVTMYILARGVAAASSARSLNLFFTALLLAVFGFVALDALGLDPHSLLPSYKDVDAAVTFEEFNYYSGEYRRLRGFFGEASVLSGVVVVFASIVAVSRRSSTTRLDSTGRAEGWSSVTVIAASVLLLPFVLSKAGMIIAGAGLLAYAVRWMFSARFSLKVFVRVCGALAMTGIAAGALLVVAPSSLRNYLELELQRATVGIEGQSSEMGNSGLYSRYDHWGLTLQSLASYPLGSGTFGVGKAYDDPRWFNRNREMDRRIPFGVYGLLNQWANLAAQTGLYGLSVVIFIFYSHFAHRGDPAARWLLSTELVAFLFTVETYPYLALIPLAARSLAPREPAGFKPLAEDPSRA